MTLLKKIVVILPKCGKIVDHVDMMASFSQNLAPSLFIAQELDE